MGLEKSDHWQERLDNIVETMRELSLQTDPQQMVKSYAAKMQSLFPAVKRISLSRRGLSDGQFRVTRHSDWKEEVNPWKQQHKLPLFTGGILGELIYADKPCVLNDVQVSADDPAAQLLTGTRSLMALPLFDQGTSLNMVVATRDEPHAFEESDLPERVWLANLFGRAAHNLVLAEQLETAYRELDRELRVVADIQRSLLPKTIPKIATMQIAHYYETSRHAGGDYFDFFRLPDDRWGILIADVSGHGTPSAVVMAVLHSIAHMYPGEPVPPSLLLSHLNEHLTRRYTSDSGRFATAFYAIYHEKTRELIYSAAGHNPPRFRRCGESRVHALDQANSLPLGIMPDVKYINQTVHLNAGDRIAFFTDGMIDAVNHCGELYGTERFDNILSICCSDTHKSLDRVLEDLRGFTGETSINDDRTLLIADVE